MIKKSVTISNKLGLHARASAKLTKLAGSYPCEVWLARGGQRFLWRHVGQHVKRDDGVFAIGEHMQRTLPQRMGER